MAEYKVNGKKKKTLSEMHQNTAVHFLQVLNEFAQYTNEERVQLMKHLFEIDFQNTELMLQALLKSYKGDIDALKK